MKTLPLLIALLCVSSSPAQSATPGGTFYRSIEDDPTTLNVVTRTDVYAYYILELTNSTLLGRNDSTYQWVPELAESYEIAKDGSSFTFTIRDGVKWSDGKPLTVEDVKYSFDVYFEGRFDAPFRRLYFEKIKEAKILGPRKIQFLIKEPYFHNFDVIANDMLIIPKHFYGEGDPKDAKFNKISIGTGPYMLEEWDKGQKLVLKKNPDYFGKDLPYWKDRFKFDRVFFRVVRDDHRAAELLKAGELDFIDLRYNPEIVAVKSTGPEWQPGGKVVAVKGKSRDPGLNTYGFIAWNEKNPLFKEKEARQAMSHLINRQQMAEKFRYNLSDVATGPFGNRSPNSSPKVKPRAFDPKKALNLLTSIGWKITPEGLTRAVDGKTERFEFTLVTANPDFEKYATVMMEDMKAVGIKMNYKPVEWATLMKLHDERKFDALNMGWSEGDLDPDPKRRFHSESIPSPGDNIVAYSNPKLDALIDKLRATTQQKKLKPIYHQIHEIIAEDEPYTFFFNPKFWLYGASRRIHRPKDAFEYALGRFTWSVGATK